MVSAFTLALKEFKVFKGLDDEALSKIADLCRQRAMTKGEIIFSEGTSATHLHLCHSGKVDIVMWVGAPWRKNVVVHRVEAGELFGWSALVAPYTYTASAECVEAGEEICIRGSTLLEFFDQNPDIGFVVMSNISADISARLTRIRQRFSIEWLIGLPSSPGSAKWGEPNKR